MLCLSSVLYRETDACSGWGVCVCVCAHVPIEVLCRICYLVWGGEPNLCLGFVCPDIILINVERCKMRYNCCCVIALKLGHSMDVLCPFPALLVHTQTREDTSALMKGEGPTPRYFPELTSVPFLLLASSDIPC